MEKLKQLQAQAGKLIHDIQAYRAEHRENWTADRAETLKKMKEDFMKLQDAIALEENAAKDDEQFAKQAEKYARPSRPAVPLPGGNGKHGLDRFSKEQIEKLRLKMTGEYIRGDAKNEELAKRKCRNVFVKDLGFSEEDFEALQNYRPEELHALNAADDSLGASWIVPEFKDRIIQALPALSQVAGMVTREPTSSDEAQYPFIAFPTGDNASIASSDVSADWVDDTDTEDEVSILSALTQDEPGTGIISVRVNNLRSKLIKITHRLIQDARADISGIAQRLLSQTFALAVDRAIIKGSGVGQPKGILNSLTDTQTIPNGHATELKFRGICDLAFQVNEGYAGSPKAGFLIRRASMSDLLTVEDGSGRFIFNPDRAPGMLLGYPLKTSPYMDAVGADNYPMLFGDFAQYVMADRMDMMIMIYREIFAPNIGLRALARLGGKLTIADSFRKLKMVTSL